MKLKFKKSTFFTHTLPKIIEYISNLDDLKEYVVEIKVYFQKRSNNANSYYWRLVEEIARGSGTSKDEVHEVMLERYGAFLIDLNDNIIGMTSSSYIDPVKQHIHCRFKCKGWQNGEEIYIYYAIKGSSLYDSREMKHLIDGAVSEAKEMGIETKTPQELELLKYE